MRVSVECKYFLLHFECPLPFTISNFSLFSLVFPLTFLITNSGIFIPIRDFEYQIHYYPVTTNLSFRSSIFEEQSFETSWSICLRKTPKISMYIFSSFYFDVLNYSCEKMIWFENLERWFTNLPSRTSLIRIITVFRIFMFSLFISNFLLHEQVHSVLVSSR